MARNLKSEGAATYHKIQESNVNSLWVGKGENLGRFKAFFLTKTGYLPSLQPCLAQLKKQVHILVKIIYGGKKLKNVGG